MGKRKIGEISGHLDEADEKGATETWGALLWGKWDSKSDSDPKKTLTLSVSFPDDVKYLDSKSYNDSKLIKGFSPLLDDPATSLTTLSLILSALDRWESVANIEFIAKGKGKAADITFSGTTSDGFTIGGTPPVGSYGDRRGDIWISKKFQNDDTPTSNNGLPNLLAGEGSYGFAGILHEIGHALGLKHPFEEVGKNPSTMRSDLDYIANTIMSYRAYAESDTGLLSSMSRLPSTPMLYDIAAIQELYGPNFSYYGPRSSEEDQYTVYRWDEGEEIFETIWDAGGIDTIDWSNQKTPAEIDLRNGHWSKLGPAYYDGHAWQTKTLAISFEVYEPGTTNVVNVIENAKGGTGDDEIRGNKYANEISGGGGSDTIIGDQGVDTLSGGEGEDYFEYFTLLDGLDIIRDFDFREDYIEFRKVPNLITGDAWTNFISATNDELNGVSGTLVSLDPLGIGGGQMPMAFLVPMAFLENVDAGDLSARNFFFPEPSFSISPASQTVVEGDLGETSFDFTISVTGYSLAPISVDWTVSAIQSPAADPADFVGGEWLSGSVTFAPGEDTPQVVSVPIQGDTDFELDESFVVTLSNPTDGALIDPHSAWAAGYIQNDDNEEEPSSAFIRVGERGLGPSISADGTRVAYYSRASNIDPNDTNNQPDIFVTDIDANTTVRANVSVTGEQANLKSDNVVISPDGRYVAFRTEANNLISEDTNGVRDVYIKDLVTNTITNVNSSPDGELASRENWGPTLTVNDGVLRVAFKGFDTNFINSDNRSGIYFKDVILGSDGGFLDEIAKGPVTAVSYVGSDPSLSFDGNYLSYAHSYYSAGTYEVFLANLSQGTTGVVATDADGNPVTGSRSAGSSVSADGEYVVFWGAANDLVENDTNGVTDIFVKHVPSGAITRANTYENGDQVDAASFYASISDDGRYVTFESTSPDLVAGDVNNQTDVFVKDLATNAVARVSTEPDGIVAEDYSTFPVISGNGRYVAFFSSEDNLVPDDGNGYGDTFVAENPLWDDATAGTDPWWA